MFYQPRDGSSLPVDPLNAIIVPRPIGWISTVSVRGVPNLAPYSFFNAVAYKPPQIMFSATSNHAFGGDKDAVADAQGTGEFVVNIATWELRKQMNKSSVPAPHEIDEFQYAGLTKADSELVRCPRVAESPVHLECRYTSSTTLLTTDESNSNTVVFGEIIGVHINDTVITDGRIDFLKLRAVGRLGYRDFVEVNNVFSMELEKWEKE